MPGFEGSAGFLGFLWLSVALPHTLCVLLCVHFHLDCTLLLLRLIFLKIQNENVRSNLNILLMIS